MFNALEAIRAGEMGTRARERREYKNALSQAGEAFSGGDYTGAANALLPHDLGAGMQMVQYGQQQEQMAADKAQAAERQKLESAMALNDNLLSIPEAQRGEFLMQNWQQFEPIMGTDFMTFWQQSGGDVSDATLQQEGAALRTQLGISPETPEAPAPFTLGQGQQRFDGEGNMIASVAPRAVAPAAQVTVNTGDEVDTRPITATPSKDVQRVWDSESGTWRDEVIPGSPAARENELLNSKAFQALQANEEQFDAIMTNIDAADELIGPFTAGVGSYLQVIRGTPAKNLEARLETVKANIGFDKLNEMRQTSPTGGALGQVTERELKFLQSVRGSLDEQQSPAQLRQTLSEIKASLQRLAEVREIAFKLEQQNAGDGQIVATEPLQSSDLPEGFALQGEDADLLEFMTPEERALFQGGAQ
ncbi:MAG: hypothetical protein AAGK93_07265 [Pseudomonadota bacterium]